VHEFDPRSDVARPEPAPEAGRTVADPHGDAAGAVLADGREHELDPRTVTLERIARGVFAAVVTGGGALALLIALLRARTGPLGSLGLIGAWAALAAALAAGAWFWPPVRYRHCSWSLDDHGLTIRRGVFWRSVVSIPRSRVQHTDVSQGPVERALELATLIVHTAGTQHASVSLGGLPHETALRLRDHLIDVDDRDAV
jgi:membrane protein YdbS with pleckstrin-like domain